MPTITAPAETRRIVGVTVRWVMPGPRPGREPAGLVQVLVGGQRQEVREVLAERDALEDLLGLLGAALLPRLVADLVVDLAHLLVEHLPDVVAVELAVADPLPDLGARDLRGGGVLHHVVDPRGAAAAEPERDVLEADGDVVPQPLLGDLPRR